MPFINICKSWIKFISFVYQITPGGYLEIKYGENSVFNFQVYNYYKLLKIFIIAYKCVHT